MTLSTHWTTPRSLALLASLTVAIIAGPALSQPPGGFPAPPVKVAEVRLMSLAPTVPVPGSVISRDDTRLAAESPGRLLELAEVGAQVAAGEVIARIDDALLREEKVQIEAEKRRGERQVAFLEREVERLSRLAATNAAAERELDDTQTQLALARQDIAVVDARLAQNRVNLERALMRAPFAGQITQRFVNPGERVAIGDQVLRVIGRERIEVVAQATATAARFLYTGADVAIGDETGREGVGTVRTVVPFGDSTRHMYELRIDVPADEWLIAQAVELRVPVAVPEELLVVPRDALVLRRSGTYVMRINQDNAAERVDVTTGVSDGPWISVTGDITAGDRVVVRGAERLSPGTTVRVLEETPSGGGGEGAAAATH